MSVDRVTLTIVEANVLRMRLGLDTDADAMPLPTKTLTECSKHFGVSRERIRQIEKAAYAKLGLTKQQYTLSYPGKRVPS